MSVPLGQDFSPTAKKEKLTDYFNQPGNQKKANNQGAADNPANSSDDVIVLD